MGSTRSFFRYGLLFVIGSVLALVTVANLFSSATAQGAYYLPTTTYLTSGTSWVVPAGWGSSDNTIEVIGGGGNAANGGGGGGGAYSRVSNVSLTPGATVTYQVGGVGQDTYFCNSTSNCTSIAGTAVVVGAKGGSSPGAGGAAAAGIGSVKYSGGNGGGWANDAGAGGGGAAGPNGNGNNGGNGSGVTGGDGGSGDAGLGGAGGIHGSPGGVGGAGTEWDATHGAGGGGGGGNHDRNGGAAGLYGGGGGSKGNEGCCSHAAGSQGIIAISYTGTTPITISLGASGSGPVYSGDSITYTITRNGPATYQAVPVQVTLGGTAVKDTDYSITGISNGVVTIPANTLSANVVVTVLSSINIIKTFTITLPSSIDYDIASPTSRSVDIAPIAPALSLSSTFFSETQVNVAWSAQYAYSCSVSGPGGFSATGLSGTRTTAPGASTAQYVLSCDTPAGMKYATSTAVLASSLSGLTNGLISYWSFDAADMSGGTVAKDVSPNACSPGTLTNAPTPTTGHWGDTGGALAFNGSNTYVTGQPIGITTGAISVSAWVYSTNFAQNGMVVEKDPVNTQWEIFFEGGLLKWRGGSAAEITAPSPANNVWHHIVATQSGTTANLYIDGVLVKTGTVAAIGNSVTGSNTINIGRYNSGYYFNGSIDEVMVYNRAISAEEVIALQTLSMAQAASLQSSGVAPQSTPSVTGSLSGYSVAPFLTYPFPKYTGGAGNSAIQNPDGSGSWPGPSYFSDDGGSYNDTGGGYGDLSGYAQPILPVAAWTMGLAWFNSDPPLQHAATWYADTPSPLTCYWASGSNDSQGQGKCLYFGDKKGSRIEAIIASTTISLSGGAGVDMVSTYTPNACTGVSAITWQYVAPTPTVFKVPQYTQVTTQLSCQPNQAYIWPARMTQCPYLTCYNVDTVQQRIFRFADKAKINGVNTTDLTKTESYIVSVSNPKTFTLQCGGYAPEQGTQIDLRPQFSGIDDFNSSFTNRRYDPLATGVHYPFYYDVNSQEAQWNGPVYWPWTVAYYNIPNSTYYHPQVSLTVEACPGANEVVVGGVCTACVAPTPYRSANTCIGSPPPTATIDAGAGNGVTKSVAVGESVSIIATYTPSQTPQNTANTVTITSATAPSGSCGNNCWTVPYDWPSSDNTIEVWGGGGGGAGDGSATAGSPGIASIFNTTLNAGGGLGGAVNAGAGGAGGSASGGNTTNTSGSPGLAATNGLSGRGGNAPGGGGAGGAGVTTQNTVGNPGSAPGGGGGGAYTTEAATPGSGGGSGGYVKSTNVALTPNSSISYQIGSNGVGGTGTRAGGAGALGRIVINYTTQVSDTLTATAINNDTGGGSMRSARTITINGDTQVDTAQSKFGGASALLDGTSDFMNVSNDSSLDLGVGGEPFTIDVWVRRNGDTSFTIFNRGGGNGTWGASNGHMYDYFYESGSYYFQYWAGSAMQQVSFSGLPTDATWAHHAVDYDGTTMRIYVDGVVRASAASAGIVAPTTRNITRIGTNQDSDTTHYYDGWLDELRVSKGIARYGAAFTPPSASYVNDQYTTLLLHMDGADATASFADDTSGGSTGSNSVDCGKVSTFNGVSTTTYSTGSGCENNPDANKTYTFTANTPGTYTFSAQIKTASYPSYNGYATVQVVVCPLGQASDGNGGCVTDDICSNDAFFPGDQTSVPSGARTNGDGTCSCTTSGHVYTGTICELAPVPDLDEGSFTATRVRAGNTSTLSWSIDDMNSAVTCSITPSEGLQSPMPAWTTGSPWVGSVQTTPIQQATKYTLTCTTVAPASASKSVIVNIVPTYQEI